MENSVGFLLLLKIFFQVIVFLLYNLCIIHYVLLTVYPV